MTTINRGKFMRKFLFTVLMITAGAAQAGPVAVTIDFDDTLPTYFGTTTHQEDGFTLTSNVPAGTLIDNNNLVRGGLGIFGGGNNTQSIFWGANDVISTLSLVEDSGKRFDLLSLDASSLLNLSGALTLSGTKYAGGATVSQVITLNGTLSTYNITGMDGITDLSISFDGGGNTPPFDLDNIQMSVVPLPAGIWLFGSAMVGLAGWSRRRIAATT
jgi:hypothetical protein